MNSPDIEPVAWGRVIDGKAITVSLVRTGANDEPLYAQPQPQAEAISFGYTNYRGENSFRHARPISIRYGTSEWHKREGWLLLALDLEKHEEREFAMRDMLMVEPANAITLYAHPQPQQADGRGAVIEALDNSQSLLAMIHQLNTNGSVSEHDWETEGLSDLITKQIKENRAALQQSPATDGAFTQCEKCWQPATCKKYGCREPAVSRPDGKSP